MQFWKWVTGLRRRRRRRSTWADPRQRLPAQLFLTCLEDRRVLSVGAVLSGDVLEVQIADPQEAATIRAVEVSGVPHIEVAGTVPGDLFTIPSASVNSIQVHGTSAAGQRVVFADVLALRDGLLIDARVDVAEFEGTITGVKTGPIVIDSPELRLGGGLQTDGQDILIAGELVLTAPSFLDTEIGDDDVAGAVRFAAGPISAADDGFTLSIDTSSSAGGGDVDLAAVNNSAKSFLESLSIRAGGSPGGSVQVGGPVFVNTSFSIDGAHVVDRK
jgi:hypothetical protein